MVKIIHNVGGLQGLDVALDVFSEEMERQIFESRVLFRFTPQEASSSFGKRRNGHITGPFLHNWDADAWRAANLVGECFPERYVPPDYCLALSYPQGAEFKQHYDSRYRWGECVACVCLGQACVMYFIQEKGAPLDPEWKDVGGLQVETKRYPSGKMCVEVTMPRRCVYIFHGPARMDWKHGIRMQTADRLASFPPPSTWNPWNLRRSLTLRTHKAYSDAYLQHQLELHPNDANLQARWNQQKKLRPQLEDHRMNNTEVANLRAEAQIQLQRVLNSPFLKLRFGDGVGNPVGVMAMGTGHRLGGGEEEEDAELQAAIRASLAEAPPQAASSSGGHRLGGDMPKQEEEQEDDAELQAAIRLSLGESSSQAVSPSSKHDGTAGDPIALDGEEEENDEKGNNGTDAQSTPNSAAKRDASVGESEEDHDAKRQRLRLARLNRFCTENTFV